ncbi:dihydrofolate reductase [Paenibacillus sp. GCM10027626]|uniref:dihydrofolate reductase n=1 Tax=Paenibacillus sp. GCM10027626 TaxID=3273411 RepID=UPI0036396A60
MTITLIAAMASNRVIGIDNKLPWRLPEEMAHFRRSTTGKTVIMGRKTFESLGGALKNRRNVIITRNEDYNATEGCEVAHSIEAALQRYAAGGEELMVIGGAEIYRQFLPHADKLLLTEVFVELEGDAYFPAFASEEWENVQEECHERDEKHAYPFCIRTYRRRQEGV